MSRNGSGSMSVINTFVSGATIAAAGFNANDADFAAELTNSLALDGQSVMTGQFKAANGTVGAPGIAFGADLDSGWYRIGADNIALALGGALVVSYSAAGVAITGTLSASGNLAINTNKFTIDASTGNAVIAGTLTQTGAATFAAVVTISAGGAAITGNSTVTGTLGVSSDFAVNTNKFTVTASSGNTVVAGTLAVTGNATFTAQVSGATAAGAMLASSAEQVTGTAANKLVTPSVQHNHSSAAKTWCKVGVSGDVADSYNVTSVTDGGAGAVTFVIATDFASAAWAFSLTTQGVNMTVNSESQLAGTLVAKNKAGGVNTDPEFWHMAAHGAQ